MGLLDWIRGLFAGRTVTLDDEDEVTPSAPEPELQPVPAPEPPPAEAAPVEAKPEKKKRRKKKKSRKQRSRDSSHPPAEAHTPKPKRRRKKKRKYGLQPDGVEAAPEPPPVPLSEMPLYPAFPDLEAPSPPAPEPAPEPEPAAVEAAPEPAPAPEPAREEEEAAPSGPPPMTTRDWVVLPKLEAVLADASAVLDEEEASRESLIRGRKRLEREWDRLLPVPRAHSERLRGGYAERLAALNQRIAAIPDPRRVEEEDNRKAREALLSEAAALLQIEDVFEAITQARALQQRWKTSGRVARSDVGPLNERWKEAMDAVYARREAEWRRRIQRQEALVQQAERLVGFDDATRAAEAMKGLQQRWKTLGGVPGEASDALWARFRLAADRIFERRRAAMTEQEQQNKDRKAALIAEAERMAAEGVEDAESAADELHRQWKRVGRVPREDAEAMWARFKAATDQLGQQPTYDTSRLSDREEDALRHNPFAALKGDGEG